MATITVNINNKSYPVECEDAQQQLIERSATEITKKYNQLKALSPIASTEYLLLLCALSTQSEILTPSSATDTIDLHKLEDSLSSILLKITDLNSRF